MQDVQRRHSEHMDACNARCSELETANRKLRDIKYELDTKVCTWCGVCVLVCVCVCACKCVCWLVRIFWCANGVHIMQCIFKGVSKQSNELFKTGPCVCIMHILRRLLSFGGVVSV